MSYRYLFRLHFLVRFKNRPITRTAIFFNIHFILKTLDLRSFTSGDELQNYHSINLNFLHEKIVSAPQNTCSEFTEVSFTQYPTFPLFTRLFILSLNLFFTRFLLAEVKFGQALACYSSEFLFLFTHCFYKFIAFLLVPIFLNVKVYFNHFNFTIFVVTS